MAQARTDTALSVSQFTQRVKHALERTPGLQGVTIRGEVASLTLPRSGHCYFSLQDEGAVLNCVMFRSDYERAAFAFQSGDEVEVTGSISLFAPRGSYQLIAKKVRAAGMGQLYQRFLELQKKLQGEGLFDESRKQPLPSRIARVALITSATGAVLHDIQHTVARRFPALQMVLVPSLVQGSTAPAALVKALGLAQRLPNIDAVVLARGGGSLEDLWAFNDEALVRAVAACPLPTLSAVGHETDFTLCDFAADLRVPTPTAAAELLTPDSAQWQSELRGWQQHFAQLLLRRLRTEQQRLDDAQLQLQRRPQAALRTARQQLTQLQQQLMLATQRRHHQQERLLAQLTQRLSHWDQESLLQKGYSRTLKNGKPIASVKGLKPGQQLTTILADGRVQSRIEPPAPPGLFEQKES